jgi:hypothetical protein
VRIFDYVMMAAAAFKKQAGRAALVRTTAPGGKLVPGPPPKMLSGGRPGLLGGRRSEKYEYGRNGEPGG